MYHKQCAKGRFRFDFYLSGYWQKSFIFKIASNLTNSSNWIFTIFRKRYVHPFRTKCSKNKQFSIKKKVKVDVCQLRGPKHTGLKGLHIVGYLTLTGSKILSYWRWLIVALIVEHNFFSPWKQEQGLCLLPINTKCPLRIAFLCTHIWFNCGACPW